MQLAALLKQTFGFAGFRANQEAVCQAATAGRDVLLVMPTGAGKSLCYQLPAIARGGTGLVVSPLIALMDDQAGKLTAAGLRVARIHSGLSREDSRQACRDYLDGKLQFLFIAPERMRVPGFPEMLARRKPSLIAVDEAHCISAWGHDFRPDYRTLGDFLPALRPAPIIALTATATPTVQKDIVAQLHLQQAELFIHGFRRDNLAIEVVELSKPKRTEFITDFLQDKTRRPAIVYAPSRKAAEELAGQLGRKFQAAAYHAGLEPSVRERVQRHFLSGKVEVVVATIAFGMGIDKADVRTVMHAALPASVEAYYQEIGRAGRDGEASRTVLLYSYADRKMHDFFLDRDYPPATDLVRVAKVLTDDWLMTEVLARRLKMDREVFLKSVEKLAAQGAAQVDMGGNVRRTGSSGWQAGYEQQMAFRRSQIDRMMDFATLQQCRMGALIRHFGDLADGHKLCGVCDFCAPEATTAQSFVLPSAAEDRNLRTILNALSGGVNKSTGKLHTELALTPDRKVFDSLLDGLARAGLIQLNSEVFSTPDGRTVPFRKASLTFEGQAIASGDSLGVVLNGNSGVGSASPPPGGRTGSTKVIRKRAAEQAQQSYTPDQLRLEEALRDWRKAEAAKTGKPAFVIFSDACLRGLIEACPRTIPQLLQVSGIGPEKADRYGAALCAICRGEEVPGDFGAPVVRAAKGKRSSSKAELAPSVAPEAKPEIAAERTLEMRRERSATPEPFESLTSDQQALEQKLRDWRKAESEKMGLPQFFVLGTTALRSIVVSKPKTLAQLQNISGLGSDKLDRFGPSILAVCNT